MCLRRAALQNKKHRAAHGQQADPEDEGSVVAGGGHINLGNVFADRLEIAEAAHLFSHIRLAGRERGAFQFGHGREAGFAHASFDTVGGRGDDDVFGGTAFACADGTVWKAGFRPAEKRRASS